MRLAVYVKQIVLYWHFVQMDLAFYEPETAIFGNRVPEWINLKTTASCLQSIHIFVETMMSSPHI